MAETIEEKVANLGSDMIMSAAATTDEQNAQVEATQEAVEQAVGAPANLVNALRYMRTKQLVRDYNIRPNDKCPCGSGKKYKNCCKQSGKYEGYHTVENKVR